MAQIFRMRIVRLSEFGWDLVAEQRIAEDFPRAVESVKASASIAGDISNVFLQAFWKNIENVSFGEFICDVMGVDDSFKILVENSSEIEVREVEFPVDYFLGILMETKENLSLVERRLMSVETDLKQSENKLEKTDHNLRETQKKLEQTEAKLENKLGQTNLKERLEKTENKLKMVNTFLNGLTQWPGGFYALLQPMTGCPVDLAFFGGTHKFHKIHTEGGDSHTSALGRHVDFSSDSKTFITLEFCEVTKQFNTGSWPQGSFCVHKQIHKSCPAGFTDGYVKLDSKDGSAAVAEARNNVANYAHNPNLTFCCQNSGSASVPIQLPTSSPFLLYRYGGVCQGVRGMAVSEQYLKVDTENDRNADKVTDSHPDVEMGDSTIKFHLCYYRKP